MFLRGFGPYRHDNITQLPQIYPPSSAFPLSLWRVALLCVRHHHLLGGRGLGSHRRPEGHCLGAQGRSHLLQQRVWRAGRVHLSGGPRHLPRLHREELTHLLTASPARRPPELSCSHSVESLPTIWSPDYDRGTRALYICEHIDVEMYIKHNKQISKRFFFLFNDKSKKTLNERSRIWKKQYGTPLEKWVSIKLMCDLREMPAEKWHCNVLITHVFW